MAQQPGAAGAGAGLNKRMWVVTSSSEIRNGGGGVS
jgi:hypothetical protein